LLTLLRSALTAYAHTHLNSTRSTLAALGCTHERFGHVHLLFERARDALDKLTIECRLRISVDATEHGARGDANGSRHEQRGEASGGLGHATNLFAMNSGRKPATAAAAACATSPRTQRRRSESGGPARYFASKGIELSDTLGCCGMNQLGVDPGVPVGYDVAQPWGASQRFASRLRLHHQARKRSAGGSAVRRRALGVLSHGHGTV
jgi:hypothetical protein